MRFESGCRFPVSYLTMEINMNKGSDHFKKTIQKRLDEIAEMDPLFQKSLEKEHKNIDDCINYILTQVKKIGAAGYTDDEIYGMAVHYYDEDDLEKCNPVKMGVVVNHKPELTDQEKEELRKQARDQILAEERERIRGNKPKQSPRKTTATDPKPSPNQQSSLF